MQIKPQWDITSHVSDWPSSISQQTTRAGEDVEKREPFVLLMGMQTDVAIVESSMELPQKIKNATALWPSDSTSGIYVEKLETLI